MPADRLLTTARRDALLVVVAILLLAAPVWVPALHLDDPRYRYESVTVETDGAEMAFATEPADPFVGISERIACAGARWGRACVFEHYVAANHTVPTEIYASQEQGFRDDILAHRYRYALINGTVYEVGASPNATATGYGGHRLDLALRPVEADQALGFVSVDVEEVPRPVRRAAETGSATGYVEDFPETTIELEDGRFRRIYLANTTYPTQNERNTAVLLRLGLPVVGLGLLGWSWRRFAVEVSVDIRYRG